MKVKLPRFVASAPERLERYEVVADLDWPGPSTSRFRLDEPAIADDAAIHEALLGAPENRGTQGLHCLGTAERTDRLFREAVGSPVSWPGYSMLRLKPHAQAVERHSRFAEYVFAKAVTPPHSGKVSFDFVRQGGQDREFACLSHDIVVHEVTHALLHGFKGWLADRGSADRGPTKVVGETLGDVLAMLSLAENVALLELAGAVFRAIVQLPCLSVEPAQFVREVVRQAGDALATSLATALVARGFDLEGEDLVPTGLEALEMAREALSASALMKIEGALGSPVEVAAVRRLPARRRRRFPTPARAVIDLALLDRQSEEIAGSACITLGPDGRGITFYCCLTAP